MGSQSGWVWVAAVAPKDQNSATLAIAKAHIQAVIVGSHADGLYVHRGDRRRAISVLKADAARHHYKVDFGDTKIPTPKSPPSRKGLQNASSSKAKGRPGK